MPVHKEIRRRALPVQAADASRTDGNQTRDKSAKSDASQQSFVPSTQVCNKKFHEAEARRYTLDTVGGSTPQTRFVGAFNKIGVDSVDSGIGELSFLEEKGRSSIPTTVTVDDVQHVAEKAACHIPLQCGKEPTSSSLYACSRRNMMQGANNKETSATNIGIAHSRYNSNPIVSKTADMLRIIGNLGSDFDSDDDKSSMAHSPCNSIQGFTMSEKFGEPDLLVAGATISNHSDSVPIIEDDETDPLPKQSIDSKIADGINRSAYKSGSQIKKLCEKRGHWISGKVAAYIASKDGNARKDVVCAIKYDVDDSDEDDSLIRFTELDLLEKMVKLGRLSVGSRVGVYWSGDDVFYEATIVELRMSNRKCFFIQYDDGESEWINLWFHEFKVLDENSSRSRESEFVADDTSMELDSEANDGLASEKINCEVDRQTAKVGGGENDVFANRSSRTSFKRPRVFVLKKQDQACDDVDVESYYSHTPSKSKRKKKRLKKEPPVASGKKKDSKHVKRGRSRRAPKNEVDNKHDYQIGDRLSIFWSGDNKFYNGTVVKVRPNKKCRYVIEYDDGDVRRLDLKDWKVRFLGGSKTSETEVVAEGDMSIASTDKTPSENPDKLLDEKIARIKVGTRVAVWWEDDRTYYEGTVAKKQPDANWKPYFLEYDDGDAEWIDFRHHEFKILSESSADGEKMEGADPHSADISNVWVGSRLSVWWPDAEEYYDCTVTRYRDHKRCFYLEYDDGDREWIDLTEHEFLLCGDSE